MTLSPYDYCFWLLGFLLDVYVVVCTIARKSFLRYLPLNLYMLAPPPANRWVTCSPTSMA